VFTVSLLVFALIGTSVRMYFDYVEQMKAHEARGPWARTTQASPAAQAARAEGAEDGS